MIKIHLVIGYAELVSASNLLSAYRFLKRGDNNSPLLTYLLFGIVSCSKA